MKNALAILLFMILILGLEENAFSQRKTKTKSGQKTPAAIEPKWNKAEMLFGGAIKITAETIQIPKQFGGHDFIALFANLKKAVSRLPKEAAPERRYELLKNVKLLGDLTIDDYFIFKVQLNSGVNGVSQDSGKYFSAETFQLRKERRIEADRDMFGGCYGMMLGPALPRGNSPEDFIKSFSNDAVWEKSYLLLNTVKPIYNERNYKGKLDDEATSEECRFRYVVPSPQAQYELAFTKPQGFELAESKTVNLSLEDYKYYDQNGIGVIAWHTKGEKSLTASDDWVTTLFVVKITAPFLRDEMLEDTDMVEKKKFKMLSKTFYVDIENLWVVSWKTGKIVKK